MKEQSPKKRTVMKGEGGEREDEEEKGGERGEDKKRAVALYNGMIMFYLTGITNQDYLIYSTCSHLYHHRN